MAYSHKFEYINEFKENIAIYRSFVYSYFEQIVFLRVFSHPIFVPFQKRGGTTVIIANNILYLLKNIKSKMKNIHKQILRFVAVAVISTLWSCSAQKIASSQPQVIGDRDVTIFAVNDLHAALECFPRLAFMADSLRNIYPELLVVSAGDNQTGNPLSDQYDPKGLPVIQLMNAVDFDLSAVGNHEFDSGAEGFAYLEDQADFDFLCANLQTPKELDFDIEPYKIFNLSNGLKVGIVSLLQVNNKGIPDCHPKYAKEFKFLDPFKTAQQYVGMKDSCDVVMFVNHLGVEGDYPLCEQLPKGSVDVIIGGHSHTKIAEEEFHNGILYTQAEKKLKYGTLVQIKVAPDGTVKSGMKLMTVGSKGNEKKEVRDILNKIKREQSALMEPLAKLEAPFTSKDQLGYLMADALFSLAPVDMSFINRGGVRIEELLTDQITTNDVYEMDPFGNELVLIDLTGNEIYDFYKGAFYADDYKLIYSAGLTSKYDINGKQLVGLELFLPDGTPLDRSKTYKVSMSTYLLSATKFEHRDPGNKLYFVIADGMQQVVLCDSRRNG